jgi:gamma-glutamyltranspeptidase/glutathione hydrolase
MFGLVQGSHNNIMPGKRPLSSMTPTVVLRDGKLLMVLGSPGGSRIITTLLQTLINVIDYGMNIQEAVDAPRIHQQWMPSSTYVEKFALSPDVRNELINIGQRFTDSKQFGHVAAIIVGAPAMDGRAVGDNRYYGANDPRGNTGLAAGY